MKKVQDHYFQKAKREGYAARSAYKLEEIDRRRKLLKPGQYVLDLGCAPGSWTQYAAGRVGGQGRVLGVDLQPAGPTLPSHAAVRQADAFELAPAELMLEGRPFDVILSDMAPKTSGIAQADAARSAALVRHALALAAGVLKPGGVLLAKVFQGGELPALRKEWQACFEKVTVEKPKASRSESVEVFLLGVGFRPGADGEAP